MLLVPHSMGYYKTCQCSPTNLGEKEPEATESDEEGSTTQNWPTQIRPLRCLKRSLKNAVPVLVESEAGRLLAARIPPELFDDILFYVNADRQAKTLYLNLERKSGTPSPKDIMTDLKQCSLVCLFWANRCRQHMFLDRTLEIKSYEDAKIFRRYIIGGCPRLTPVHRLITDIFVTQTYRREFEWAPQTTERQTSFLHLLYLLAIQDKLKSFSIEGPVPDSFNPAELDTPHWGIPPSMVVPNTVLRKHIAMRRLHLPSFYHVTKYIRHFACATYIEFEKITWDGQTPTYLLPQASNKIACQRRPRSLLIRAQGVQFTDSVHLVLTALMLNPNCPLRRLSNGERAWMMKFMTLLWGHKKNPEVSIRFDVSEQTTTMRLGRFHFAFEEAPATHTSTTSLSVVGMHAYINEFYGHGLPDNFDALVNHARTHPTIRAFVLLLDSFDRLQKSIKPFVQVLALVTEPIELMLAYEEKKERRAVGVDLVKLEPDGRFWSGLPQSDQYERDFKSLHILQTQLKKKIRGSVF